MVHALIINKPHYLCIYRDLPYVQIDRHLSIYKNETQTVYIVRYTYIYIHLPAIYAMVKYPTQTNHALFCRGNPKSPTTLIASSLPSQEMDPTILSLAHIHAALGLPTVMAICVYSWCANLTRSRNIFHEYVPENVYIYIFKKINEDI